MRKTTISFFILFFGAIVYGHEDPAGDIHPYVSVNNKGFSVNFTRSLPPDWKDVYYQIDFDITGKQFGEKKKIVRKPSKLVEVDMTKLSKKEAELILKEEEYGPSVDESDYTLFVQDWFGKHKGKPSITKINDKKKITIKIDWGNKNINIIHFFATTKKYFVFLASQIGEEDFEIIVVDRKKLNIVKSQSLGVPARIYDNPRTSGLIFYKGTVFVAWVEPYVDKERLILSSFELKPYWRMRKEILPVRAEWNTTLSMKEKSGVALLAYHCAGYNYEKMKHRLSEIKVVRIELEGRADPHIVRSDVKELKFE